MSWVPVVGDVVYVSRAASVQFGPYPFLFRVIRVLEWETYAGWVWLEGYELSKSGDAVERRRIFVQPAGLRKVDMDVLAANALRRARSGVFRLVRTSKVVGGDGGDDERG